MSGIAFEYQDAYLIHNSNIFPIICDLFYSPALSSNNSITPIKKTEKNDGLKLIKPEDNKESKESNVISSSSWIAFKLLASQCVSWNQGISSLNLSFLTILNHFF